MRSGGPTVLGMDYHEILIRARRATQQGGELAQLGADVMTTHDALNRSNARIARLEQSLADLAAAVRARGGELTDQLASALGAADLHAQHR